MSVLLKETNLISLRTAYVDDDGNLADFSLMPADLLSVMRKAGKWDFDWASQDAAWLYRHLRSPDEETTLSRTFPPIIDQDLRPMTFKAPPEFKLLWADSGHSVALYLNGEPWAFIDEETHQGYSKGILKPFSGTGNLWDQDLFERTFPDAA